MFQTDARMHYQLSEQNVYMKKLQDQVEFKLLITANLCQYI